MTSNNPWDFTSEDYDHDNENIDGNNEEDNNVK
jgi:hypothetical protein